MLDLKQRDAYESARSGYFHSLVETVHAFTRAIYIFADFYFLYSVVYYDYEVWGITGELTEFFKGRNISCFAESLVDLPTGQTLKKTSPRLYLHGV
jgi:hypothetical protein